MDREPSEAPLISTGSEELGAEVTRMGSDGWDPQGGIASIEAGTTVYLLQAIVKR